MKRPHLMRLAALLILAVPAPALAQDAAREPPAAQPETSEPIVVTGDRASAGLVVDLERIAQRCIACRRALQRLRAAARRNSTAAVRDPDAETDARSRGSDEWLFAATRPRNAMARDQVADAHGGHRQRDEFGSEVGLGMAAGADDHRNSLRTQEAASRRAGQAVDRVEAGGEAERFTANLLAYVEPIVERIRQERRADAVFERRDPAARGQRLADITDAVIAELDRNHRGVDLLQEEHR
jgi:hypothetical protein